MTGDRETRVVRAACAGDQSVRVGLADIYIVGGKIRDPRAVRLSIGNLRGTQSDAAWRSRRRVYLQRDRSDVRIVFPVADFEREAVSTVHPGRWIVGHIGRRAAERPA